MIRINLLSVERQLPGRRFTFDLGGQTTVLSALILVVAAVLVVSQFFSLRAESQALDDELAGARQEIQRLQAELEQVRLFDERRAQLELRIALIAELQRGQVGPVQMLDQVSQNLPDSIWLTEMRQEGNVLVILGRAMTLNALSDFVANLERSGYFIPPVDLIDSQLQDDGQGQVVRFEVRAQFFVPGAVPVS